jgi:membrane-bound serine protease (ClpP class)
VLGGVGVFVGVVMSFTQGGTYTGLVTLGGVILAAPLVVMLMRYLWPRTQLGELAHQAADPDATVAAMPVNVELEQLRGRYGRAVSPLRPSGVVDFDGRRIDVITEGIMVDADSWVRCIDVKTGKVVVRPVDKPDLGNLESADFS